LQEEPESEAEPHPLPDVPGIADANMVVRVEIEPKAALAESGAEGVARFMNRGDRTVLEAMAQSGWEVKVVDEQAGLYMLSLPSVNYDVMGASISIPAPRFLTAFRDMRGRGATAGSAKVRAEGDLVLQNGEDIFTLELGFPFRTRLQLSAAGWTRAAISWDGDKAYASNYVEVGVQIPKVPGLSSILEYFVKNYGEESTLACALALARAADNQPAETPLESIEGKMKEIFSSPAEISSKS